MKRQEISLLSVDYREPPDTGGFFVIALGSKNCDTKARLKYGDITWATEGGTYGFELKSNADFLHSLWSKDNGERLETQLDGLRHVVDFPVLAVHGVLMPNGQSLDILDELRPMGRAGVSAKVAAHTGYKSVAIDGFLWSIQHPDVGRAVTVLWRPTKEALLHAILEVYHWSQKPEHSTFNHLTSKVGAKPTDEQEVYVRVLMGVPDIGEATARALIGGFKTPIGVALADEKDLLGIKGIGKKTIQALKCGLGVS